MDSSTITLWTCSFPLAGCLVSIYLFPHLRWRGHIVFGADPVGLSVGVGVGFSVVLSLTFSFLHNILWTSGWMLTKFWPASVAQLDAPSDWRPGGRGFNPRRGRQHSFVEIDHEIFSTVILSLPLIQEGQLSVSGERMCTILVNRLED